MIRYLVSSLVIFINFFLHLYAFNLLEHKILFEWSLSVFQDTIKPIKVANDTIEEFLNLWLSKLNDPLQSFIPRLDCLDHIFAPAT